LTFAVSGRVLRVFSRYRCNRFLRPAALLPAGYLPLRSHKPSVNRTWERYPWCTSPEIWSSTACDRTRSSYDPELPTSGTFRPQGFSPSRRLPSPGTLQGLFHPRYAHEVPADDLSGTRPNLSIRAGRRHPRSFHKAFPPPTMNGCWPALLSHASPILLRALITPGASFPVSQLDGHHRVSIAEGTAFPQVMNRGCQPSRSL
jgi:hypothetical protein